MKPLLVGEVNPYGADPAFALYPLPEGATGHRLQHLVMGIPRGEYLRRFDRVNLCTGKWSIRQAREAAAALLEPSDRTLVLLGAKVMSAFGKPFHPFTYGGRGNGHFYVVLPHPSGLNRMWAVPGAYDRAREILRLAEVLPADRKTA